MSFRVSALVAGLAVMGLAEVAPVLAQPQAPIRPRYSTFGNIFSPSRGPNGVFMGNAQMQPFINPIGPQVAGVIGGQGFAVPGQGFVLPGQAVPQALIGAYGLDPNLRPTGVVGTFNNLGHWYPGGYTGGAGGGYYGHWYPNGIANGRGILGYGGGGGGFVSAGGVVGGGMVGPRASPLGTALTAGAAINQMRR